MLIRKKEEGFTLLELLVSISIIALISGIFMANYHSANKRSELVNAAQKLASDIRLAQNYSLGLREFNGQASGGGWGVYFNKTAPNYYIIFADINGNKNYNASLGEKFKQVDLPAGVSVNNITDVKTGTLNNIAITFLPPDPTTYIAASANNKAQITLRDANTGSTKTVEVNFLGLVEVVD